MYTEETPAHGGNGEMHLMDKVFSPACADMPHDVYAELLTQCPVSRQTGMFGNDVVMLSRYEDVLWALVNSTPFRTYRFSCGRRPEAENILPTTELLVPTLPPRWEV